MSSFARGTRTSIPASWAAVPAVLLDSVANKVGTLKIPLTVAKSSAAGR